MQPLATLYFSGQQRRGWGALGHHFSEDTIGGVRTSLTSSRIPLSLGGLCQFQRRCRVNLHGALLAPAFDSIPFRRQLRTVRADDFAMPLAALGFADHISKLELHGFRPSMTAFAHASGSGGIGGGGVVGVAAVGVGRHWSAMMSGDMGVDPLAEVGLKLFEALAAGVAHRAAFD